MFAGINYNWLYDKWLLYFSIYYIYNYNKKTWAIETKYYLQVNSMDYIFRTGYLKKMMSWSKLRKVGVGLEKLRRFKIVWEHREILDSKQDIWKKYKLLALIYLHTLELHTKSIIWSVHCSVKRKFIKKKCISWKRLLCSIGTRIYQSVAQ